jgi:hypothetical protein
VHHRLEALLSMVRIGVGRLTGNRRLERIGRAELARSQAERSTNIAIRPASNRFRVGVGQMTHQEQLAAQVEIARLREQLD